MRVQRGRYRIFQPSSKHIGSHVSHHKPSSTPWMTSITIMLLAAVDSMSKIPLHPCRMPPPLLAQERYLQHGAIKVQLSSILDKCGICMKPYKEEGNPVLLPQCGHIFCQTCITEWFETRLASLERYATCPTCRTAFFDYASAKDEEDHTNIHGANALRPRPHPQTGSTAVGRTVRPAVELYLDNHIIARNHTPTLYGCRIIIRQLWHQTFRLMRSIEDFCGEPPSPLDMDVELLRSCIQTAIPEGVRCEEGAWAVLYEAARRMLVWHSDDRLASGRWEEGELVMGEEVREFVEGLWEGCRMMR